MAALSIGGRQFCPECGCPPWTSKAELKQGVSFRSVDAPTHKLWIKRREARLRPVDASTQFQEDSI
jgi:hypothetical protein